MKAIKQMSDAELTGLSALLIARTVAAQGENALRAIRGECPAYTEIVDAKLEAAIEEELKARGCL